MKPVKFGRLVFDNFREQGLLHLLSHAHRDHTYGLKDNWTRAPILCTEITAKIIRTWFPQIPEVLFILKNPWASVELEDVEIQIADANHCPGAVMFSCISRKTPRKVVFTGDFRLNSKIRENIDMFRNADLMYLDSTFNRPVFRFPSQTEAISEVIELIEENVDRAIYLGVYSIGKNKIIKAVSEHFKTHVYTPPDLYKVYTAIGMQEFITTKKNTAWIHAYPRQYIQRVHPNLDGVKISATGWACLSRSRPDKDMYYVPYSEHNDYNSLQTFIRLTRPKKIVPI